MIIQLFLPIQKTGMSRSKAWVTEVLGDITFFRVYFSTTGTTQGAAGGVSRLIHRHHWAPAGGDSTLLLEEISVLWQRHSVGLWLGFL